MGRARILRPEFFIHEGIGTLPPLHRLLFAGLWTLADREGRLEDRPTRIKVQVLPWDECDVGSMLDDLAGVGSIVRYGVGEDRFIAIPSFLEYQTPHIKEAKSVIPPPSQRKPRKGRGEPSKGSKQASPLLPRSPVSISISDPVSDPDPVNTLVELARRDRVLTLFSYWQEVHGHPNARLDDKLRKVLDRALETFELPALMQAVDGCKVSPHHQGQNESHTVYDSLELICRDAKHVNMFVAFAARANGSAPLVTYSPRELAAMKAGAA